HSRLPYTPLFRSGRAHRQALRWARATRREEVRHVGLGRAVHLLPDAGEHRLAVDLRAVGRGIEAAHGVQQRLPHRAPPVLRSRRWSSRRRARNRRTANAEVVTPSTWADSALLSPSHATSAITSCSVSDSWFQARPRSVREAIASSKPSVCAGALPASSAIRTCKARCLASAL